MNNNKRLLFLLQQIQEEKATPAEYIELKELINADRSGEIIQELNRFYAAQAEAAQPYNFSYWDSAVKEILLVDKLKETGTLPTLKTIPVRRSNFLRHRRWWAAAAIFMFVSVAMYAWLYNEETSREVTETKIMDDVLPGKNGAILTLEDGSEVILDSLNNGTLAKQGNTEVKLRDHRLIYEKMSASVDNQAVLYNSMRTSNGRQFKLLLPDGTQVWLNAASSIRYPTVFTGKQRRVEITGEVYFEVTRNTEMPFIVQVNTHTTVEVLGTHFNINAYEDEASINTTLLEGSVKVSTGGSTQLLSPGQQAKASQGIIALIKNADMQQALAWKNGLFSFTDADLPTVMRQLARWYNVKVEYEGGIPKAEFSGKIDNTLTLSQLLKGLAKTRINYRIENGNKIIIRQ